MEDIGRTPQCHSGVRTERRWLQKRWSPQGKGRRVGIGSWCLPQHQGRGAAGVFCPLHEGILQSPWSWSLWNRGGFSEKNRWLEWVCVLTSGPSTRRDLGLDKASRPLHWAEVMFRLWHSFRQVGDPSMTVFLVQLQDHKSSYPSGNSLKTLIPWSSV